ncbi:replication protein [Bifidobacterium pseudolongum subsp. globosum]|uniref:Replication protein n=2 Tax=Bifidobacterium pseudolongum TaxID=1694 RepID=A0A8B3RLJ6_9BIFI|nr:replication protein [Bifidobacterium pseudolongum subsp. globosum]
MEEYGSDAYRVSEYIHPFDGYQGEATLILDEFDGTLPLSLLLNVLDGYRLELPARYSNRLAKYTRVIIISNAALSNFYTTTVDPSSTPDRLRALYRRITRYVFMDADGTLLEKPLPTIGRTHDNAVWKNDVYEEVLPEEIF